MATASCSPNTRNESSERIQACAIRFGNVGAADGIFQWGRTLARSALSSAEKSRFVHMTKGRSVQVKLNRKVLYELDGGDREKKKTFRVDVQPNALTVCVPASTA